MTTPAPLDPALRRLAVVAHLALSASAALFIIAAFIDVPATLPVIPLLVAGAVALFNVARVARTDAEGHLKVVATTVLIAGLMRALGGAVTALIPNATPALVGLLVGGLCAFVAGRGLLRLRYWLPY